MPPTPTTLVETLQSSLDKIDSDQDKLSTLLSAMDLYDQPRELRALSGTGCDNSFSDDQNQHVWSQFMELAQKHGIEDQFISACLQRMDFSRTSTHLEHLECANHDLKSSKRCKERATKICNCKHKLRSKDWKPEWVEEQRRPSFMDDGAESSHTRFGVSRSLWGNMPAFDILNLKANEGLETSINRDLALAFVASGDIRNVIRTVNELPKNYGGTLDIVINDRDPMVQCRNLLLLIILGMVPDLSDATEIALHFWYSLFLPSSWLSKLGIILQESQLLTPGEHVRTLSFGSHLTLNVLMETQTQYFFAGTFVHNGPDKLTPAIANNTFYNFMNASERVDYVHRYYAGLEPSHRLAIQEWRRFGVLYPFSASSAYLNTPNPWLFGHDHTLFLNDHASPSQGWDVQAAFEVGKAHGTTQADIMGCLYFYIKDQLHTFAQRLRTFKMNISLFKYDAIELGKGIKGGTIPGIPRSILFDRIEVSNATDLQYAGVKPMLEAWGPFLKTKKANQHASLIGLFMNWAWSKGAKAVVDNRANAGNIIKTFVDYYPETIPKFPSTLDLNAGLSGISTFMGIMDNIELCHENSEAFNEYLRNQGALETCKNIGLRSRKTNTIIPHRIGGTLGHPWKTLPKKMTVEKYIMLGSLQYVLYCGRPPARAALGTTFIS
ncbi:hypothetical protein D9758_010291 [Tetrapyrgos nigripes]|uniref:DUF4470 domain-containing protein n=1 Tax=Tetrapyrgos nigripes TaxID=182062 RepID=A0A8H5LL76_9AGAR|nr:hypothetical protein D9758_010291 [Tetrapyrgos nigripes]